MAKPETIDEYIAGFSEKVQDILQQIRRVIHEAAPDATEAISYAIPTFKLRGKNLIHFAAFKDHIGLYATPAGHAVFAEELSRYQSGKGSVQFPLSEPMPLELINHIVRFRVEQVMKI